MHANPKGSNSRSTAGAPASRISITDDVPIPDLAASHRREFPSSRSVKRDPVAMARRQTSCCICDQSNLASICPACVNLRMNNYHSSLRSLKAARDSLHSRLIGMLVMKRKADDQINWRLRQKDKATKLRDQLKFLEKNLLQDRVKAKQLSDDLKARNGMLESAFASLAQKNAEILEKYYPNYICTQSLGLMAITSERLYKQSVVMKQICKLFPMRRVSSDGESTDDGGPYDQICNARLPKGLDPHSIPSNELSASLGYIIQLLNIVIPNVAAPALHNSGFAGSCSRIWQRDSYRNAFPSTQSKEYPLFIQRQNGCTSGGEENSWADRSSTNFGVSSVESEKKPSLESPGSFNYTSASPHSVESHKELQRGISLIKKSVACITSYCYNSLGLEVPPEASTFEAFAKLLAILSSSKEMRSVLSSKHTPSRSGKQAQQLNKSIWHAGSNASSNSLVESTHSATPSIQSALEGGLTSSAASFLYPAETNRSPPRDEGLVGEWDMVERATLPPPPSEVEDTEHWTRAMFTDATATRK